MDLINAQKQAKEQSKSQKGTLVYVILEEDEFKVVDFTKIKDTDDVYSIWRDGAKIDSPNGSKSKTENVMATKTKSAPKKVATPKKEKVVVPKKEKAIKNGVTKKKVGASYFFEPDQWTKIEAVMKKDDISFNAWANQVIFAKLKGI